MFIDKYKIMVAVALSESFSTIPSELDIHIGVKTLEGQMDEINCCEVRKFNLILEQIKKYDTSTLEGLIKKKCLG